MLADPTKPRIVVLEGAEGSGKTEALRETLPESCRWFDHSHYADSLFCKDWVLMPPLRTLMSYFSKDGSSAGASSASALPAAIVLDDMEQLDENSLWTVLWQHWSRAPLRPNELRTYQGLPYVIVCSSWKIARWTAVHNALVHRIRWPKLTSIQLQVLARELEVPVDANLHRLGAMVRYGREVFPVSTQCWEPYSGGGACQHSLNELVEQLSVCDEMDVHEQWWLGKPAALHDSMVASAQRSEVERRIMRVVLPFFQQRESRPALVADEKLYPLAFLSKRKQHLMMCSQLCQEGGPFVDVDGLWARGESFQPHRAWVRFRCYKWS